MTSKEARATARQKILMELLLAAGMVHGSSGLLGEVAGLDEKLRQELGGIARRVLDIREAMANEADLPV